MKTMEQELKSLKRTNKVLLLLTIIISIAFYFLGFYVGKNDKIETILLSNEEIREVTKIEAKARANEMFDNK